MQLKRTLSVVLTGLLMSTVAAAPATALQPTAKKKCASIQESGASAGEIGAPKSKSKKKCPKNFSGRDLSYASLSGNFKRANFSNANLDRARFEPDTNAQRANFSGASMKGAQLKGNFNRAKFSGIDASFDFSSIEVGDDGDKTSLRFSDWSNTAVGMSGMSDADFTGANFSGSTLRITTGLVTGSTFANANFTGATIYPDRLVAPNADFTGSTISVFLGSLSQADLRGANFTNTTWVTTDNFGKARSDIPWDLQALDTTGATWVNVTCPDGSVRNAPCWQ